MGKDTNNLSHMSCKKDRHAGLFKRLVFLEGYWIITGLVSVTLPATIFRIYIPAVSF